MSDLQLILIIVGVFIIAGVVAYNYIQEHKLRNKITRDFIVPQTDVLTEDFYIDADAYLEKELPEASEKFRANEIKKLDQVLQQENAQKTQVVQAEKNIEIKNHVLDDHVLDSRIHDSGKDENLTAQNLVDDDQYAESVSDTKLDLNTTEMQSSGNNNFDSNSVSKLKITQNSYTATTSFEDNLRRSPLKPLAIPLETEMQLPHLPLSLHSQIDLTAVLFANQTINSTTLNKLANEIPDINQIMVLYALDDDDKWQLITTLTPEKLFKQVSCSMQLADRGGPVARHTLNKFQFAVENMGSELNAHVEWQIKGDAMQHALALDQFCIEVDQLISVHLIQNENPIHGTKFKGIAEANGLNLNNDGKFYYYGYSTDVPLFSIIDTSNQTFTLENLRHNVFKSISFQLEIPKVNNSEQVFNQMIIMAQKMASSLGATLVDDKQKPLGDLQVEKIRQQLKIIHAKMVARNIMPGSPSALRLFN